MISALGWLVLATLCAGTAGWCAITPPSRAPRESAAVRPPGRMRRRGKPRVRPDAIARQLPDLTLLLATALRAGAAPVEALAAACQALPGPAAEQLQPVVRHLRLGADPVDQWTELARQPGLGPLGRALARAHRHGASASETINQLAEELAEAELAAAEERARSVGVRAALPLGLCLLPAFVLLAVVPIAAGLLQPLLTAP